MTDRKPTPITSRRTRDTELEERDRADRAAAAALETATPGPGAGEEEELDPPASSPSPAPAARVRDMTDRALQAPIKLALVLRCPSCNESATVEATLSTRVVRDSDGTGHLALRTRAAKVGHVCGQIALGLVEGPRVR